MTKTKASKKKPEKPLPRVGHKYQAEIPSLIIEKREYRSQVDPSNSFSLGFPEIPLVWENREAQRSSSTITCTTRNEGQEPRFEPRNCTPLPGCPSEAWSEIEQESFVLGLYIFEKNLALVKRFVGTKKMRDILCFYYGKFYNSDAYRRWSECLRSGNRGRFYGRKLFTGWRQDKLLARLFGFVKEDFQDMLVESSLNFNNERVSFEDYVFTLKDIVGLYALVKAVGIGQGKKDLTGTVREPRNREVTVSSVDPKTLFGKAYSSLTPSEIVKILKGNSGLRKSQYRELFARAVWPRLLAQGWRSEEVKDHKALGLKKSTVFLVHGEQKFSRRLVKGKQYFNSVSAVMDAVASQPQILGRTEKRAAKDEGNGSSDSARDTMKFTVVDTSLVDETEPHKVSGLRNWPSRFLDSVRICEVEELRASKPEENGIEDGACFFPGKYKTAVTNGKECVKVAENGCENRKIVLFVDNNRRSSSPSTSPVGVRLQSERMNREKPSSEMETERIEEDMEAQTCSDRCDKVLIADTPPDEELASAESPAPKLMFDLNLPYVPLDFEEDVDMAQDNDDLRDERNLFDLNIPYVPSELETNQYSDTDTDTDMRQDNGDLVMIRPPFPSEETRLRQSARSRAMTKRALEALELKLFSSKRWRK